MSTTLVPNWHPAAEAYPMMSGDDYERLKESVKRQGILKPIEVYAGTAWPECAGIGIDGRNRARAAEECGVDCPIRQLTDEDVGGSIIDYITSANSVRRHEDAGMRAVIAVGLEQCYAEEAKERQRANGGDRKSAEAMRQTLENKAESNVEKIPHSIFAEGRSRAKAAEVCDVNERYVQDAKKLFQDAPTLFKGVKAGAIKLVAAVAALKRKDSDPEGWTQLLEGAMPFEVFQTRMDLMDTHPDLFAKVRRGKLLVGDAIKEAEHRQRLRETNPRRQARKKAPEPPTPQPAAASDDSGDDTAPTTTNEEFLEDIRQQMPQDLLEAVATPPEPNATPEPIATDSFGRLVPRGLVKVFNDAEALRGYIESLGQLIAKVCQLATCHAGRNFPFEYRRLIPWVQQFRQQLEWGWPKCVCPVCQGTGQRGDNKDAPCLTCKGPGWISAFYFDRLSAELREMAWNWRAAA